MLTLLRRPRTTRWPSAFDAVTGAILLPDAGPRPLHYLFTDGHDRSIAEIHRRPTRHQRSTTRQLSSNCRSSRLRGEDDGHQPRLWTVQDVADYLGVPVRTLYHWRCRDYGPRARKVGRYLRYEPAEVRSWFASLDDCGVGGSRWVGDPAHRACRPLADGSGKQPQACVARSRSRFGGWRHWRAHQGQQAGRAMAPYIDESDRVIRRKITYRDVWNRCLAASIGELRIGDVRVSTVDRVIREIRERRGPERARHSQIVLSSIFGDGRPSRCSRRQSGTGTE